MYFLKQLKIYDNFCEIALGPVNSCMWENLLF